MEESLAACTTNLRSVPLQTFVYSLHAQFNARVVWEQNQCDSNRVVCRGRWLGGLEWWLMGCRYMITSLPRVRGRFCGWTPSHPAVGFRCRAMGFGLIEIVDCLWCPASCLRKRCLSDDCPRFFPWIPGIGRIWKTSAWPWSSATDYSALALALSPRFRDVGGVADGER